MGSVEFQRGNMEGALENQRRALTSLRIEARRENGRWSWRPPKSVKMLVAGARSEPTRIAIEDTDGFEAYYKAQVTPWFAVTGDVQVITAP